MEEDIEKALNNLWNSLDDEFFNLTYSQEQMQEDVRLILNRYNYLDSKCENLINKCKELRQELAKYEMQAGKLNQNMVSALEEAFKYSLEIKDLEKQNKEQEKMIELMAECLAEGDCDAMCSECGCYKCEAEIDVVMECIKKYFKKKAKGE